MDRPDLHMSALSPADRGLFAAMRASSGDGGIARWTRREWRAAAQRSLELQCGSLLWQALRDSGLSRHVPADVATRLGRIHAWSLARNRALFAERDRIAHLFAAAGIPVIALKGAHVAELYDGLGARPVGDIDLLVSIDHLGPAMEALVAVGYRPDDLPPVERVLETRKLPDLQRPDGFPVDLHWRVKGGGDLAEPAVLGFWKRARPIGEGPCLGMEATDALVYAALHLARSHGFATRNAVAALADVAVLLRHGADVREAVRRAESWGLGPSLFLTLRLAADLLGAPVSQEVLRETAPEGWEAQARVATWTLLNVNPARSLLYDFRPTLNPPPPSSGLLGEPDRLSRLGRYLWDAAFPALDDLAVEFRGMRRGPLPLIAYPLHWAQLGIRHAGLLRWPLVGDRVRRHTRERAALREWLEGQG